MSKRLTAPVPRRATDMTDEQKADAERICAARKRARARLVAIEAEMNEKVIELREAGVSLRAIAQSYGLNHQTVQNIVDRAKKAE